MVVPVPKQPGDVQTILAFAVVGLRIHVDMIKEIVPSRRLATDTGEKCRPGLDTTVLPIVWLLTVTQFADAHR